MKTTHTIAALAALSSLAIASSASAQTGAYDGRYDLNYGVMNMAVQCGYAAPDGTVDFDYENYAIQLADGEVLPVDAFDAFLAQRIDVIEASNLTTRQKQVAEANATAFFTGLRLSLDAMVQSYPDHLQVSAIDGAAQPSPLSYAFDGQMTDDFTGTYLESAGAMNYINGLFALQPTYVDVYRTDMYAVGHTTWAAAQLGGSLVQRVGALRWNVERMEYDQVTGELWGCGVSNLVGFEIAPEGESARMAPVSSTSFSLSTQPARAMKSELHRAATRELVKEGVHMNRQINKQVSALGRALAR